MSEENGPCVNMVYRSSLAHNALLHIFVHIKQIKYNVLITLRSSQSWMLEFYHIIKLQNNVIMLS